jgi:uncharacterized protein YifE (UPF0438 family)
MRKGFIKHGIAIAGIATLAFFIASCASTPQAPLTVSDFEGIWVSDYYDVSISENEIIVVEHESFSDFDHKRRYLAFAIETVTPVVNTTQNKKNYPNGFTFTGAVTYVDKEYFNLNIGDAYSMTFFRRVYYGSNRLFNAVCHQETLKDAFQEPFKRTSEWPYQEFSWGHFTRLFNLPEPAAQYVSREINVSDFEGRWENSGGISAFTISESEITERSGRAIDDSSFYRRSIDTVTPAVNPSLVSKADYPDGFTFSGTFTEVSRSRFDNSNNRVGNTYSLTLYLHNDKRSFVILLTSGGTTSFMYSKM